MSMSRETFLLLSLLVELCYCFNLIYIACFCGKYVIFSHLLGSFLLFFYIAPFCALFFFLIYWEVYDNPSFGSQDVSYMFIC